MLGVRPPRGDAVDEGAVRRRYRERCGTTDKPRDGGADRRRIAEAHAVPPTRLGARSTTAGSGLDA